jgi:uncharacterized protein YceH (UPF0502 family)
MAAPLERTEQRIIGVLIEKELTVPDIYPLTVPALVAGCNQKNNRDPVFELREFEVEGALMSLRLKDWISKSERDGGRSVRYRHRIEDRLGVSPAEKAILAELLVRGPQAPGALKTRVERMGVQSTPEQIEHHLRELMAKGGGALVEQLPLGARERDRRWAHLLGPRDAAPHEPHAEPEPAEGALPSAGAPTAGRPPEPRPAPGPDLAARVLALETAVQDLRNRLERLEGEASRMPPT